MTMLKRQGFSTSYTCILPSGDHLAIFPDCSAERTRTYTRTVKAKPRAANACKVCCDPTQVCDNPKHQPVEEEWRETKVIARCRRQRSVADTLSIIAPGVDFGVRPDGTFPVLAYMPYSESTLKAYPHLKDDITEGVE